MTRNERSPQGKPAGSIYSASHIGPILFITLIFFLTFVARLVFSPLTPEIEASLGISHAQCGSLFLFMSIGYFLGVIGSGCVSALIFHRSTIIVSALGVGVALCASSIATGILGLAVSVGVIGLTAGLYLPSGITTLTGMVEPNHWAKAISIHEIAPNLGFVATPLVAEMMLIYFPWRIVPSIIGIASICAGLLFAFLFKGGNFPGKAPSLEAFRVFFSLRDFWIMGTLSGLAISSTMGIYTMLPLYLVSEVGISRNFANTLLSLSRIFGLFSVLLSGWAADRFGFRRTISIMLGLTGVTTIGLGLSSTPSVVTFLVFIQAALATCYFPAGFALLSSIGPPAYRNVAISLTIPFSFLFGGGVVPSLIGMAGDMGNFPLGIVIIGAFITAGAVLPRFLKSA